MWNSAVPRVWRRLTSRPFLNLKSKKRDTLQFLVETQKYIHNIRKPQILDEPSLSLPQPPSESPASQPHKPSASKRTLDSTLCLPSRDQLSSVPKSRGKLGTSTSLDSLRKMSPSLTVPPLRLSETGFRRKDVSRLTVREPTFEWCSGETEVKASRSPTSRVGTACKVDTWRKRPSRKAYALPFKDYLAQNKSP